MVIMMLQICHIVTSTNVFCLITRCIVFLCFCYNNCYISLSNWFWYAGIFVLHGSCPLSLSLIKVIGNSTYANPAMERPVVAQIHGMKLQ